MGMLERAEPDSEKPGLTGRSDVMMSTPASDNESSNALFSPSKLVVAARCTTGEARRTHEDPESRLDSVATAVPISPENPRANRISETSAIARGAKKRKSDSGSTVSRFAVSLGSKGMTSLGMAVDRCTAVISASHVSRVETS